MSATRYVHKSGSNAQALVAFLEGLGTPQLLAIRNSAVGIPGGPQKAIRSYRDKAAAIQGVRTVAEAVSADGKVFWIDTASTPVIVPGPLEDGIPAFLKLSPEQRAAAWVRNPPKAIPAPALSVPQATPRIVKRPRTDENQVIHIVAEKNPRREGSKAAQRFGLMKEGMSVAAYVNAVAGVGGRTDKKLARRARRLVTKSVARGHIELRDPARGK